MGLAVRAAVRCVLWGGWVGLEVGSARLVATPAGQLLHPGFQGLVAGELEARHHGDLVGLLAHLGVEGAKRSSGAGNGFSAEMRRKADQIAVVSRFKFTREQTLETSVQ